MQNPRKSHPAQCVLVLLAACCAQRAVAYNGTAECLAVFFSEKEYQGLSFGFSTGIVGWTGNSMYYNIWDFGTTIGFNANKEAPRSLTFNCTLVNADNDTAEAIELVGLRLFSLPLWKENGGVLTNYTLGSNCITTGNSTICHNQYDELIGQDKTASGIAILFNFDFYLPGRGYRALSPPPPPSDSYSYDPPPNSPYPLHSLPSLPSSRSPTRSPVIIQAPPPPRASSPSRSPVAPSASYNYPPYYYEDYPPDAVLSPLPDAPPDSYNYPPFYYLDYPPDAVPSPTPSPPPPARSPSPPTGGLAPPDDCAPCQMPLESFTTSFAVRMEVRPPAFLGSVQDHANMCSLNDNPYNFKACNAVNMLAPAGSPVYAPQEGTILAGSDFQCSGTGSNGKCRIVLQTSPSSGCSTGPRKLYLGGLSRDSLLVVAGSVIQKGHLLGYLASPDGKELGSSGRGRVLGNTATLCGTLAMLMYCS
eukprot:gene17607-23940_t